MASGSSDGKSLAERFFALFGGLTRAYGRYVIAPDAVPDADGKVIGRLRDTVADTLTPAVWAKHLREGSTFGLGVVPINDDNVSSSFGAIDVDVYPLDLAALEADVRRLGLPLTVCRTKSGGAHLYLFCDPPAPARFVREKLAQWAAALGHPGVEVFPKQNNLASEKDTGNWINVPYQNAARTTRYALRPDGTAATAEEFLELAASRLANREWMEQHQLPGPADGGGDWHEAPPCLQELAKRGFSLGQRNNALFNVAVYLRKRHGDGWAPHLDDYNQKFMQPPLPDGELADVKRSLGKKSYSYKCKDEPICSVCSKSVCKTREHGVRRGTQNTDAGVEFGAIIKLLTEPPTYIWEVDGVRLELEPEQVMDQRAFSKVVFTRLDKYMPMVKNDTWYDIVRGRLAEMVHQDVPVDATQEGQWGEHLAAFCTSRVRGRSPDELLIGKPYTGPLVNGHADGKSGEPRTYFRSSDFISYLQQHRVTNASEKKLYVWLLREGLTTHELTLKGKRVGCWSVPPFSEQTQDHDVPRRPVEEM